MSNSRRACPVCGTQISIGLVAFGSEKSAFRCAGCNTRLMKKSLRIVAVLGVLTAWFLVKQTYGWGAWPTWAAAAALMVVVIVWSMLVVNVRLATPEDPERTKAPPAEKIPDGPPPPCSNLPGQQSTAALIRISGPKGETGGAHR